MMKYSKRATKKDTKNDPKKDPKKYPKKHPKREPETIDKALRESWVACKKKDNQDYLPTIEKVLEDSMEKD